MDDLAEMFKERKKLWQFHCIAVRGIVMQSAMNAAVL